MTVRFHYLDSMRSILMIMGVFLHSANLYMVSKSWQVTDSQGSIVFDYLVKVLHVFRMPAFFIVSGFFTLLVLQKYGPDKFLLSRAKRLLVPFAATLLFLNILQGYLIFNFLNTEHRGFFGYLLSVDGFGGMVFEGRWISHLWFLVYLFIFALGSTLCCKSDRVKSFTRADWFRSSLHRALSNGHYMLAIPLVSFLFVVIAKLFPLIFFTKFIGLFSLNELLKYLPYFLYGVWLFSDDRNLRDFLKLRPWQSLVFGLSLLLLVVLENSPSSLAVKSLSIYLYSVVTWYSCAVCFLFFRKFFSNKSKIFTYLSEASYSIYLFHQIIVIFLGILLLNINVSVFIKYTIIVVSVMAITLFFHDKFILKFKTLRLLFNGK